MKIYAKKIENHKLNFWDPKMNAGTGWGEIQILRQDACKKVLREMGEYVDIEIR